MSIGARILGGAAVLLLAATAHAFVSGSGTVSPTVRRVSILETPPDAAEDEALEPNTLSEEAQRIKAGLTKPIAPTNLTIEDGEASVRRQAGPAPSAPSLGTNVQGIDYTGSYPPDGGLAAGPLYLVQATNGAVAYYTKDGTRVFQTGLSAFLGTSGAFDPRVLYDQGSGRFIVLAANGAGNPSGSNFLLSISSSSDPRDGFCTYTFGAENPSGTWADYPTLGVSETAIFFGSNQFNSGFVTNKMFWINKSQVLTCGSASYHWVTGLSQCGGGDAFTVQPAQVFGSANNAGFLAATSGSGSITIWRVTDMFNTDQVQSGCVSVGSFSSPPDAPQPGGGVGLDTGDTRLLNLIYRNNHLYTAHNGAGFSCPGGSCSAIFYNELDVTNFPSAGVVQDFNFGSNNFFYMYPGISVDASNQVSVGFTRTSQTNNEFASARYTGRTNSDPVNTFQR